MTVRKAVFLDRDGIICRALPRGEYLLNTNQFFLLDGISSLLKTIQASGYFSIVVTNQGQISKGLLSEGELKSIHLFMEESLARDGALLSMIYFCPHHDIDRCECRKPKPGMLLNAARDFSLDLKRSIMVGDSDRDVGAGRSVGCKTIFVRNEFNAHELPLCTPDFIANSLYEVESLIKKM